MKGRSTEAAAEEADTDADADAGTAAEEAGADADADAVGEGGVGAEVDNDGNVEVDDPVAALDVFPPFFFVMAWCVGVCGSLRSQMGSSRG